jgi:riboflavin kinase/FMN adenylyltransferase
MVSTSGTRRWSAARSSARAPSAGRCWSPLSIPHPVRFFKPDAEPFRLTSLDQRERLFAAAGADAMIVFRFDAELAATSAEDFVAERLGRLIGAAGVVTGEDFTFGKGRAGTTDVLARLGAARGLSVDAVAPVSADGEAVSSSRIRNALREGDCETAARLLTRPYAIEGPVEHGDKRGRTIGYPTANLSLGKYLRPRYGIYAVRGRLADGRMLQGAANLGIRPTFEPARELLEPYFFDFSGDLYGQRIEVELVSFIRPEARFDSLDALIARWTPTASRRAEGWHEQVEDRLQDGPCKIGTLWFIAANKKCISCSLTAPPSPACNVEPAQSCGHRELHELHLCGA